MSKMLQLVEEMHVRLNEISASEQALLRALRDALNRVDDRLLQDVRNITVEHESRRRIVLGELHGLAARIGSLPAPRESAPELAYTATANDTTWSDGVVEDDLPRSITRHSTQRRPSPGNITAELDLYFKARAS
jgi:hypothetical protein